MVTELVPTGVVSMIILALRQGAVELSLTTPSSNTAQEVSIDCSAFVPPVP